jgi:hypothetical protein
MGCIPFFSLLKKPTSETNTRHPCPTNGRHKPTLTSVKDPIRATIANTMKVVEFKQDMTEQFLT